jgi:hypothetical protein
VPPANSTDFKRFFKKVKNREKIDLQWGGLIQFAKLNSFSQSAHQDVKISQSAMRKSSI